MKTPAVKTGIKNIHKKGKIMSVPWKKRFRNIRMLMAKVLNDLKPKKFCKKIPIKFGTPKVYKDRLIRMKDVSTCDNEFLWTVYHVRTDSYMLSEDHSHHARTYSLYKSNLNRTLADPMKSYARLTDLPEEKEDFKYVLENGETSFGPLVLGDKVYLKPDEFERYLTFVSPLEDDGRIATELVQ